MHGEVEKHVVVIGAGIVGACTALALVRAGWRVTLLEAQTAGGPQSASYGNGAFISPASIVPMSMPGLWRAVPGYLRDRDGPLTLRPASVPRLAPWLVRFLLAGATVARVRRTARILRGLIADAPARHLALAGICGRGDLIRRDGLLYVFADRAAYEREALAWRLRRENGLSWTELEGAALHRFEPALAPGVGFGLLLESGAHCLDPSAYVGAIAATAARMGARLVQARAQGFEAHEGRLTAVLTSDGPLACSHAVIASGIGSKALARAAGDRVPLEAERGYHVQISEPGLSLRVPIMPNEGKMANTMTAGGLRASGQVELAAPDAPPDWHRAEILMRHLRRTYPGLPPDLPEARRALWQGNRPSTPDGLPVIGAASGIAGVFHAFGHGHIGLNAGPVTGDLVAALVTGGDPALDLAPFSARRFRPFARRVPA